MTLSEPDPRSTFGHNRPRKPPLRPKYRHRIAGIKKHNPYKSRLLWPSNSVFQERLHWCATEYQNRILGTHWFKTGLKSHHISHDTSTVFPVQNYKVLINQGFQGQSAPYPGNTCSEVCPDFKTVS